MSVAFILIFITFTLAGKVQADEQHIFTISHVKNLIVENKETEVITPLVASQSFIDSAVITPLKYNSNQKKEEPDRYLASETYTVTAYTAGKESTGKSPDHPSYGITASGNLVKENETLACPVSLDFGTEVYIPKLNETFTCEDRGSAIVEGRLDVYIEDLEEAIHFGVQELEVQIIEDKKDRQFVFDG
ncbi:3D domain-containing protein [Oceanobacillus manasiensis]|uniref:3D domain-containing protein n=1 Tax=Oceanobacillus manasiensis TaxID=586413 RepID=UPI0005AAD774|nr:3D domain-containing protein [Oceanobacillus manasiensis]